MKNNVPNTSDIADDENAELNTCCSSECTGLIPTLATDESEVEAYETIFPYLPPKT